MKLSKTLLVTGLILSSLTGIWHFFIPYMFKWYSYIPEAPRAVIVSVDWINYLFSLLLSGVSVLLLILVNEIFRKEKTALVFYVFLVFVWLNRIVLTIVHPWSYDLMFFIQLGAFAAIFFILTIPLINIIKSK